MLHEAANSLSQIGQTTSTRKDSLCIESEGSKRPVIKKVKIWQMTLSSG